MLAQVYTYGHLVAAAFSLAVAMGFYVTATRLGDRRADRSLPAILYVLFAVVGVAAIVPAAQPSIVAARAYLSLSGGLYAFCAIAFHFSYGAVFSPERRRVQARRVVGYVAAFLVLNVLLWLGMFDNGLRMIAPAGIEVGVADVTPIGAFAFVLHILFHPVLLVPLLLAPGPQREERRIAAIVVIAGPLGALHEMLICTNVLPSIPLGGYAANLASIAGVLVLVERIRTIDVGIHVGPYRLERRLGTGGMAEVFLARREGTGSLAGVVQRVAFKRLLPNLAEDPSHVRMFLQEARLVARLAHPHIVALHEAGQESGRLYLAMEYVDGVSLARLLARQRGEPFEPCIAVEVGVHLADALAYAHGLRDDEGHALEIIHRDLSPQNVLVSRDGIVKLADFGIARSIDRMAETTTGVLKGKIGYMAPEQIENRGYDQRVDLYALGVLMFELLTGNRPFDGENDVATLYRVMSGDIAHREELEAASPELAVIVLELMSRDPARRYANAAQARDVMLPFRDEARARERLARVVAEVSEEKATVPSEAPLETTDENPTYVDRPRTPRVGERGR